MHLEVQVALNFVMSYLYNKLPRRRVNIFGEELEKALKAKFDGHWYPEKPCRGSAFRCLKTSNPVDPVLVIAARESGMDLSDIREHLPQDMSVWIDPGEVSFRIGEKGQIKLLMTEKKGPAAFEELTVQLERDGKLVHVAASVFNPETQVFKPVASNVTELAASLATMRVASNSPSTATGPGNHPHPKPQPVFTTAAFAQTKFGSTKLKNSSKRPNRMSPTEFSHYIKQRAMMQQQQRSRQVVIPTPTSTSPIRGFPSSNNSGYPRPRSLSPQDIFGPQDVTYGMPYLPEMNKPPAVGAGISPFPDTTGLWQPPTPGDLIGGFNSSGSASSNSSSGTTTPPLMPMPSSSSGGSNGYQNGGGYMGAGSMEPSSAYSDFEAWGSFGNSNNANNNNYHHLLVAN